MEKNDVITELMNALRPFIKEHPEKKDTVTEESVEDLISFATAFHVEEKVLTYVKAHPDAIFWDFLRLIPEGVPPGQEELLVDDDGGWEE